jgi:hypothetical protein
MTEWNSRPQYFIFRRAKQALGGRKQRLARLVFEAGLSIGSSSASPNSRSLNYSRFQLANQFLLR